MPGVSSVCCRDTICTSVSRSLSRTSWCLSLPKFSSPWAWQCFFPGLSLGLGEPDPHIIGDIDLVTPTQFGALEEVRPSGTEPPAKNHKPGSSFKQLVEASVQSQAETPPRAVTPFGSRATWDSLPSRMKKEKTPQTCPLHCPPCQNAEGGATLGLKCALGFEQECVLTDPLQRTTVFCLLAPGGHGGGGAWAAASCASDALTSSVSACGPPVAVGTEASLRLCCPAPRLLQYFRGRHHLEEIMYNENTRRSQLLMLLDKFRSVLVVTTHEDPVIAVFQALLP